MDLPAHGFPHSAENIGDSSASYLQHEGGPEEWMRIRMWSCESACADAYASCASRKSCPRRIPLKSATFKKMKLRLHVASALSQKACRDGYRVYESTAHGQPYYSVICNWRELMAANLTIMITFCGMQPQRRFAPRTGHIDHGPLIKTSSEL